LVVLCELCGSAGKMYFFRVSVPALAVSSPRGFSEGTAAGTQWTTQGTNHHFLNRNNRDSSPRGCQKAEKCGDSRSRTFRLGGNAGVRLKGQRVRESSTERTHNARRYATLPDRPTRSGGRVPARPRATWRCVARTTGNVRCTHSRKARNGTHGAEHMAAMLAANFAAMCGGGSGERPTAANTTTGARQRVGAPEAR
jgi:hypothetical protein